MILALILLGLSLVGCEGNTPSDDPSSEQKPPASADAPAKKPTYVGSTVCVQCHQKQYEQWSGSHHDRAMQLATPETVLGNFEDGAFEYYGIHSTFFKKRGKFFVRTDGQNGELAEFEITHTFGIDPLQQYLITFPDGRLQALGIAWDTRPREDGGQRWFHLYPDESIMHTDPLHWTGYNQTWNYMCADCHSTNVHKNYNLEEDRYKTTWSDINVGCEACHGPSSNHVNWENSNQQDATRSDVYHNKRGTTSIATSTEEINICAKCHARRSILAEGYLPGQSFLHYYMPALLDSDLYYSDGQILDEVYVYGSFLQSKMYHRGVRCTDCHDPHSHRLREPGNTTCIACHQAQPPSRFPTLKAKRYDSPKHHFHPTDSPGSQCMACHMPSKRFMVIDERHDHSFRIPRPDLSVDLGVPNACNACHTTQSAQWAADRVANWYKHEPMDHFAKALDGGRRGELRAEKPLSALSLDENKPTMMRATALSLLRNYNRAFSRKAIAAGLQHENPLIRIGALRGAERMRPEIRWQLAHHVLTDSVYAVRIEANRLLAPVDPASLNSGQKATLDRAISEYITAQMVNADRPEAHTNVGVIYSQARKFTKAEQAYQKALSLDSQWVPALVNLADLYRAQGRDDKGEPFLKRALDSAPNNPAIHQAYGLWLTRQGRSQEALDSLKRATQLAPETAQYAYVYGIALNSTGQSSQALRFLRSAQAKFPENLDILYALVTIHRDQGDMKRAVAYAEQLAALRPDQEYFHQLVKELREQKKSR